MHPRNKHLQGYNFKELISVCPDLQKFITTNTHNIETIDFSNPKAVKILNTALLMAYYQIKNWDIPENYLCPPIPGRADYIHYLADLLASSNNGTIPKGNNVQVLDIGTGANCIYPIVGNAEYGWSFTGSDINQTAIQNCNQIIRTNPQLKDSIHLKLQPETRSIFKNIITANDRFSLTICNPPFHNSAQEATETALRKITNLNPAIKKTDKAILNFGGQHTELWYQGGEQGFIKQMIFESSKYPMYCLWFTTLVSRKDHLYSLYKALEKVKCVEVKTINMAQGQKNSRFLAWTFQTEIQQKQWKF